MVNTALGFIPAAIAVVCFGSSFVPVKKFDVNTVRNTDILPLDCRRRFFPMGYVQRNLDMRFSGQLYSTIPSI